MFPALDAAVVFVQMPQSSLAARYAFMRSTPPSIMDFASVSCSYANLHCGLNIVIAGLRFSTRFFITFGGELGGE